MRFCNCCVAGDYFCFISEKLDKCEHCIQSGHSYNLIISSIKLDCINEKICYLYKEKNKTEKVKRELKIKKK